MQNNNSWSNSPNQPNNNPLQFRLEGFKAIKVRASGLQQVLSDGKTLYRGRIYPIKQFNRVLAVYRALKKCQKLSIVHLRLARYISPSFGVIVTPYYPHMTYAWAKQNPNVFMCGVLHGLCNLHNRHIAHRNINFGSLQIVPGHVITREQFEVQLTNFKYAVSIYDPAFRRPVGLVHYRAPELLGKFVPKDAGTAIDLWSVGIMFLELLLFEDKDFYQSSNPESDRRYILDMEDDDFEVTSELIHDEDARDLLLKLLRKDYKKRITAQEALHHKYCARTTPL